MEETWKDVPGFESYYQASNLGKILSKSRTMGGKGGILRLHKGRIMSPRKCVNGYLMITFAVDRVHTNKLIHRVVAETFIGNIPPGHEVNHLNGVLEDNRTENLEIVTPVENKQHAHDSGFMDSIKGTKHWKVKLTEDDVRKIMEMKKTMFPREIAKHFPQVGFGAISDVCYGNNWNHITKMPNKKRKKLRQEELPDRPTIQETHNQASLNEFTQYKLHCHSLSP